RGGDGRLLGPHLGAGHPRQGAPHLLARAGRRLHHAEPQGQLPDPPRRHLPGRRHRSQGDLRRRGHAGEVPGQRHHRERGLAARYPGPVLPRSVAVVAGLALGVLGIPAPPAGTPHGAWRIAPAVIKCRGPFRFPHPEQMNGDAGSFTGVGTYDAVPSGEGHCLRRLGTGTVDYWIRTEEQDVHVKEPHTFLLAGAGLFTTPTLRGTFEIPLYEGNCLTAPVTRAMFLAEVSIVRTPPPEYAGID